MDNILEARHINKYFNGQVPVKVLNDISFTISRGDFVAITGASGCGKSTLLYILSTMDSDYEGDLLIDNEDMKNKSDWQRSHIRNEKIGFVFQFHYLLNEFSVLKNVMLPGLKLNKYSEAEIEHRAMEKLKVLGIDQLALKNANKISGGEKQRVAIARALINDPLIIMADEPTGNLDKKNTEIVFDMFEKLTEEFSQTLLVVTHDGKFAGKTKRVIEMEDGCILSQHVNDNSLLRM
jgi:lipoprotein-releasing system ATP-binding protein